MSSAWSLNKELKREKKAHDQTRRELQRELERVWRLVPSHYISLMGVYPPLRKLLHVLTEAADLQDPSRGAPIEDTMRTQFVHTGDRASSSATEAGVLTHRQHRAAVVEITKQLDWLADKVSKLIPGEEWEYELPAGSCEVCRKPFYQSTTGRPRQYCSNACRQRALRNVTKRQTAHGT